jgi:hypothetical protein
MIVHVLRFANRLDGAIKQKIGRPMTSFSASAWYRKPSTARRRVDRACEFCRRPSRLPWIKVFWFFFSKKNRFLSLFLSFTHTQTARLVRQPPETNQTPQPDHR